MKKYLLILFGIITCINLAEGQFNIAKYPIDSFKLPDLDRQSMTLFGNFLGEYYTRSNDESNQHFTISNFHPELDIFYSRYINRADHQSFYTVSISPDFSIHTINNNFSDENSYDQAFLPNFQITGEKLSYKGKNFTQWGTDFDFTFKDEFEKHVADSGEEDRYNSHGFDFDIDVPLGIGTGRLEPIADMTMALFLVDDIIHAGVDASLFTPEQVNAFAQFMAILRNERVFDGRIKRIYELRELYSFMKENQWTIADDPGFFTVLTDNWIYNNNINRLSGKRWTYSFIPSFGYSSEESAFNTATFTTNFYSLGGEIRIDVERYKPVNVHRDLFRTHFLTLGVTRGAFDSDFNHDHAEALRAGISNTIGQQWIPNSRTLIRASLILNYFYDHALSPSQFLTQDDHRVELALNGTADYFVTYRTRFFANFTMGYSYNRNGDALVISTSPFELITYNTGFRVRLNGGITVNIL